MGKVLRDHLQAGYNALTAKTGQIDPRWPEQTAPLGGLFFGIGLVGFQRLLDQD
ncbi:hypothetical protein [Algoriphagus lacus]|uniref:hypothetical protein n=1 Tax=Algoriphagus lacus TaxID=2056311 RepID=UPI001314A2C2|nr:hypothetical protein [Algoriphagus lacus]